MSMLASDWYTASALICLVWYLIVVSVCLLGSFQLVRHHRAPLRRACCLREPRRFAPSEPGLAHGADVSSPTSAIEKQPVRLHQTRSRQGQDPSFPPHVTIIRPVKGLEVELKSCLGSTLALDYPSDKLTVLLCIASRADPAYETLKQIAGSAPAGLDISILVQEDRADPDARLGPNPKLQNIDEAYFKAKGDIVWIADSNVWVSPGSVGRMVDRLCGYDGGPAHRLVHQMPLAVDIGPPSPLQPQAELYSGSRLEEMFLATSHGKFYTAINTVLVAPCTVGKSTMFRRSMLNSFTDNRGIGYFSHNICEDLLMGDLMWRSPLAAGYRLPESRATSDVFNSRLRLERHALLFGDPALQPVAGVSVREYADRRVRWLRVRKYGVILATLVEPGIEPVLCSLYGAHAVTGLPCLFGRLVSPSWNSFFLFWLFSVFCWSLWDYQIFSLLQRGTYWRDELVRDDPADAKAGRTPSPFYVWPWHGEKPRRYADWLPAWILREALALPIWLTAIFGGSEVKWRGQRFRIGTDLRARPV